MNPLVRRSIAIAAMIFVVDQATKHAVLYGLDFLSLPQHEARIEILPFLDFVMVWNLGVSYGLFPASTPFLRWLLVAVAALMSAVLGWWMTRVRDPVLSAALALMLGGALGNMVDRIIYGAVADFVLLHAFGYQWYVFNVADTAITLGVALMAWDVIVGQDGLLKPGGPRKGAGPETPAGGA
jgi:signal peptidase II